MLFFAIRCLTNKLTLVSTLFKCVQFVNILLIHKVFVFLEPMSCVHGFVFYYTGKQNTNLDSVFFHTIDSVSYKTLFLHDALIHYND